MKIAIKDPPRKYNVGLKGKIEISDCGRVYLSDDEQLTFVTPLGKEHDFCAKSWGFYATPSMNGRLAAQGLKAALVRNSLGKVFVMIVDAQKMAEFEAYIGEEEQQILEWLDERS